MTYLSSCGVFFVMFDRNEYSLKLKINNRELNRVIIDQHYQLKHSEMNDDLILELVKELDEGNLVIE